MRTVALTAAFLGVFASGAALAQVPAAPPTRVGEIGLYECPIHADMVATWPARCPLCRRVLSPVAPSSFVRVNANLGPLIAMNNRRREQEEREAQRREEARRQEEGPPSYSYYGYYPPGGYPSTCPPQGHAYRYPYDYYYHPNMGQYGYTYPGYTYPYGGYFYNPGTGQYYSSPHARPYYYNPHTGQYQYVHPGFTYPSHGSEERGERR